MINFFKSQQVIQGLHGTIKALNERIEDLESQLQQSKSNNLALIEKVEQLEPHNKKLMRLLDDRNRDIQEKNKLIRNQTRADLLLNALEAVGMIDAPIGKDHIKTHDDLMAGLQQAGLAQRSQPQQANSIFGSIFSGL